MYPPGPEMVRLATDRDVYANLLRDTRGLKRDQSSDRKTHV